MRHRLNRRNNRTGLDGADLDFKGNDLNRQILGKTRKGYPRQKARPDPVGILLPPPQAVNSAVMARVAVSWRLER